MAIVEEIESKINEVKRSHNVSIVELTIGEYAAERTLLFVCPVSLDDQRIERAIRDFPYWSTNTELIEAFMKEQNCEHVKHPSIADHQFASRGKMKQLDWAKQNLSPKKFKELEDALVI